MAYQAKDPRRRLTWCIDTGAEVSLMPESIYMPSYGTLSVSDGDLIGIGGVPLVILGSTVMNLSLNKTLVQERMHVVNGASKLLLGIPAIRRLGHIEKLPETYSVKAVQDTPDHHPLLSGIKEDIVKQYPTLFKGL